MAAKITQEEVLRRFHTVHGDNYDYSQVSCKGTGVKCVIICKVHGEFRQTPFAHMNGQGCPLCGNISKGLQRRLASASGLIESFKATHGDKYDYSGVVYVDSTVKVRIGCPIHGVFEQLTGHHRRGSGCPKCGTSSMVDSLRKTTSEFVVEAANIHNNFYDYSLTNYMRALQKVVITCPTHGNFLQVPNEHLKGSGCPRCGDLSASRTQRKPLETLIEELSLKFSGRVKLVNPAKYKNNKTKLAFCCDAHGEFVASINSVLGSPAGCPICGPQMAGVRGRMTLSDFIKKSNAIHGFKYRYHLAGYTKRKDRLIIICPVHGKFSQTADDHLCGKGCPRCANKQSKAEDAIVNFFISHGINTVSRDRTLIAPKEIDIYLPDLNLAVEYNGVVWHSEKMKRPVGRKNTARTHLIEKQKACAAKGVRLIHINSDEDFDVALRTLAMITGINKNKVFARKCKVVKISDPDTIDNFYNYNHVQGTVRVRKDVYGLTYKEELVSLMSFSKASSVRGNRDLGLFELRRYASSIRVIGGASRLLKAFLRDTPECTQVVSYSDNRWFTGNMYQQLGFVNEGVSPPDYKYFKGNGIYAKNTFTHARMKGRQDFVYDPQLPERQNCVNNGYYRFWDCGKTRWGLLIAPNTCRQPSTPV